MPRKIISTELDKKKYALALSISALLFILPAIYFPFIVITKMSIVKPSSILDICRILFDESLFLGFFVFLTLIIFPILMLLSTIAFSIFDLKDSLYHEIYSMLKDFMMLDVFILATVFAKIRLDALVHVDLGLSLVFCASVCLCIFVINRLLTDEMKIKEGHGSVWKSLTLTFTALILLIPANVVDVLTRTEVGSTKALNLWKSISLFFEGSIEMAIVGIIVFVACVIAPWLKIIFLIYYNLTFNSTRYADLKSKLLKSFKSTGKISLVNIFILAILITVVRLDVIANVSAKFGSLLFSFAVIFIIMATEYCPVKKGNNNCEEKSI